MSAFEHTVDFNRKLLAPTRRPALTVAGGPAVAYCPESNVLWAVFTYTTKYVSDVFDSVTARAFSGASGNTLMGDVDCNEFHQSE
jgi:hypothetical protein